MHTKLFEAALNIEPPFFIKDIRFDMERNRLDIYIDFKRGSTFIYNGEVCKAYDTKEKQWRHLNFFEYKCYLNARVPRIKLRDGSV